LWRRQREVLEACLEEEEELGPRRLVAGVPTGDVGWRRREMEAQHGIMVLPIAHLEDYLAPPYTLDFPLLPWCAVPQADGRYSPSVARTLALAACSPSLLGGGHCALVTWRTFPDWLLVLAPRRFPL
jgi:hypothetical protein